MIDLGSGAGNDVFVARALVGAEGRVIGLDMVPDMVAKAKANAAKLDYDNVEFHLGEIEDMPLESDLADVVVSNCVLNLVPDKRKAFAEIHRVLKPGGHFCVSDIVLEGDLPRGAGRGRHRLRGLRGGRPEKGRIPGHHRRGWVRRGGHPVHPTGCICRTACWTRSWAPTAAAELKASGFGIYSITVVGYKEPEAS